MANNDLCRRLTEDVGAMSADNFYRLFNFTQKDQVFSEFTFEEMKQIYHLQGMEQWCSMLHGEKTPPIRLSMVCFKPLPPSLIFGKNRGRVEVATSQVREMLHDSFSAKEDLASIDIALSVFPTIAIFMHRLPKSTPTTRINRAHQKKRSEGSYSKVYSTTGGVPHLPVWQQLTTTERRLTLRCCGCPPHAKHPLQIAAM